MDPHASPYLEAIQAVPGSTPGQKYKELNRVARAAANNAKSHGDGHARAVTPRDVPEPLEPLVSLEIAKILRRNEVIVEALKSEDCHIVDRALKIDWFFRPENNEIINVEYFRTLLYPTISLNTRIKVIKKLSASLSLCGATSLAEAFYTLTSESYGASQASPLLRSCSESFVWDTIIRRKLVLSCRTINILFDKYPKMIIRYLKLSKRDTEKSSVRNLHRVDIHKYNYFLPRLIKNHLTSLIDLIETHDSCLGVELSNKATERFLKANVEVVLDRPILYTTMMPLKVIAAKLTKSQYKSMFARVYPPKCKDFQYYTVKKYLMYYPEQERISLLLETYEKVYNADMLDNHEVIGEEILQMLPSDERIRQARLKLQQQPDWRKSSSNIETMWRCYLPLQETLTSIKTEISKTSSSDDRSLLLQQMFFVCRVNDDKDALVQVLEYFTSRHRNEQAYLLFDVLNSLVKYFDMTSFGEDHWSIIDEFVKFLRVKDELAQRMTTAVRILSASVYFKLAHDLSIDETLEMLIEINMVAWNASWCIFEKHPEYDRRCFERMMTIVPRKYPPGHKIWATRRSDVLSNVVKSMRSFNERNAGKNSNNKMDKLSIKSYAWLLEAIEKEVKAENQQGRWKFDMIIGYLKVWEADLYELWFPPKPDDIGDVKTGEALKLMKADLNNILDHCDEYLDSIIMSVISETRTQRFVKACRWYQHIPMKFLSRCLEGLKGDDSRPALLILGILLEGASFCRLIEPLVPKDTKSIDTDSEDAQSTYGTVSMIPHVMNLVNPPVSLDLVMSFCNGEFLSLGLTTLTNVSRRSNVNKIKLFAAQLADQRVSVKKHGIRLFCLVATIADYRDFLLTLWRKEKHRSIREVIFTRIYELFVNEACAENWTTLRDCIADLRPDDDDILVYLRNFDAIPDSYIAEYVPELLATLERLEASGFDGTRMAEYVSRFLSTISQPISRLLSDQFSQSLLEKFFCKPGLASNVVQAGMRYTLNAYLCADTKKLDERLQIFGKFYANLLRTYWNQPDPSVSTYLPVNRMTHTFVHDYVYYGGVDSTNVKIMKTILESFLAVLKAQQDWTTYALLSYGIALAETKDTSAIAEKICDALPTLVETLSSVLVPELARVVKKWIDSLVDSDDLDHAMYQVIESLCRKSTSDSCTLAAKLLFRSHDRRYDETWNKIVKFLQNCQYPVAVSLACHHANTSD